MLPGWMMPIEQLIDMLVITPSPEAGRILAVLPPERFRPVVDGMKPDDLQRIIAGAKPADQAEIMVMLPWEAVPDILRSVSQDTAARMVSALPVKRALKVFSIMHATEVAMLLEAMPPDRRDPLLREMDPQHAAGFMALMYERRVARVFSRGSIHVTTPENGPDGVLMAEAFGRTILISARYLTGRDFTAEDLRHAEDLARRWRADGVLAVTNARLSRDAAEATQEAHRQGWPVDVVSWTDSGHDGMLLRALVALIR